MYNEVIANKLKALLISAIAAPLASQFGFSNSLTSFFLPCLIACIAIVLPDFLMYMRRDQTLDVLLLVCS
ncbi:hypothetical protein KBT16_07490 [Nostoc sp. CCCryo 231-06]|nr:hypothetical protein [Nostoc sp. CCCryo 231-06]